MISLSINPFIGRLRTFLSFRDKKSAALEVLYKNAMCFMDHEPNQVNPLRKLRKVISGYMLVSGGVHTFADKLHLFGVGLRSE